MEDLAEKRQKDKAAIQQYFAQKQLLANNRYKQQMKFAIWLYFVLLIFEGALRKWFLPFLATPLLIIRDPIALWVVLTGFHRGMLKANVYVTGMVLIGFASFFAAIFLGHGNVAVAFFGLRILVIHFPFMFVMGELFTAEDVIKIGRVTLWIAIPMAVLIGLQFYSPQSAWVNRGVGGDTAGAGFSGAMGYFRPPGTFSFTNGNALFFSFAAMYIFYFLINTHQINKFILAGAVAALIAAIPLSISRALIFSTVACAAFMLFALSRKPEYTRRIGTGIVGVAILVIILSKLSFFQTAMAAMGERFTTANEAEGGLQGVIGDRYFGGMIGAITNSSQLPFFGYGLGMGTNVGAMLLTGQLNFLISEGEWGRLIGEMGLLLGLITIVLRISFCFQLFVSAFQRLKQNDVLPWMMLSFALIAIPQGQWAQPTSLGFSTIAGGLVLAALNKKTTA